MGEQVDRRAFLARVAVGTAAAATVSLGPASRSSRGAANGVTTFSSPPLEKWVDPLPIPRRVRAGGVLTAAPGTHRFHRDLPATTTWGYGGQAYGGPVLEARRGRPVDLTVANRLGDHLFAGDIDTTVHGASKLDKTKPRTVLHLHGGLTPPGSDGHPLATVRPGGARAHRYPNRQEATALWYHDHAMGITRINVHAGLAGMYLLRDRFDTGTANNPLGLPAGRHEVPLLIQDKILNRDGSMSFRTSTYVPKGSWEGAQAGDVAVVNGKAWPDMRVDRGLYRFRLLNPSNTRAYALSFSNGMRFWVIGTDGGLLDAPVPTRSVRAAAAERLDLLVDFSGLAPGESVTLVNTQRLSFQFQVFGDPEIPEIMRFTATAKRAPRKVPRTLRGGRHRPRRLPSLRALGRPRLTRDMTVAQLPGNQVRFPPSVMTLNNMVFASAEVDHVRAGTVEQWNLINVTTDDHPIHLHIASFRVIGRQRIDLGRYLATNPPPPAPGPRWAPNADGYVTEGLRPPPRWERGWKDTVYTEPGSITRLLVRWPSRAELGFDPDQPFPIPATLADGAPGTDPSVPGVGGVAVPGVDALGPTAVCRLGSEAQPAPDRARGYVWHCHVTDHEDHEMMLPLRIV